MKVYFLVKWPSYKNLPICFARLSKAMDHARVLVPQDDQIVSLCFFVGIQNTKNEPHFPVTDFKVVPRGLTILETIHIVDIMLGKVQSELFVKGVYITIDPKEVKGTLIETDLKMTKKIGKEVTHGNLNSFFYHSNERKYYPIFPS